MHTQNHFLHPAQHMPEVTHTLHSGDGLLRSPNAMQHSQVCYFASFSWGRFPAPETGTQMEVQSGPAPLVKNGGWSPGESPLPAISQPACPDTARSAAHSPASPFLFPSAIRWRARAPPRGLRWIGSARKRIRIPGKSHVQAPALQSRCRQSGADLLASRPPVCWKETGLKGVSVSAALVNKVGHPEWKRFSCHMGTRAEAS